MNKKAVIYARVSYAKRREEKVSIQSQIEQSQALAKRLDAWVERVFIDDGKSAWHGFRPAFQDALDFCDAVDVDYFITWSTSRFSRNRIQAAMDKDRLQEAGVEVKYVSSPIDRATDEGWLLDGIYELFDEHQSRGISRDTKRSMIRNAKEGYWNGGRTPFGYRAEASAENRKKKRLAIEEGEAGLVLRIFEMRAEGFGAVSIARTLNEEGLTNRGKRWNKMSITGLLNNETVIGNVVFNRKDRRTGKRRPSEEWIRVKAHPAIIDNETWANVRARMEAASPSGGRVSERSHHLFTGLLTCGKCGAPMRTQSGRGTGGLYYYYNCAAVISDRAHASNRIRADKLDEWLSDEIVARIFTPETITGILNDLREIVGNWAHEQQRRRDAIIKQMQAAQAKANKIYELFETHGKSTPNLADVTRRLREHHAVIKHGEDALEKLDAERPPQITMDDSLVEDVVEFLGGQIKSGRRPQQVRDFFGSFLEQVEVHDDRVTLRYRPECLLPPPDSKGGVSGKAVWLPEIHTGLTYQSDRLAPVIPILRTREIRIELPKGLRRRAA